MKNIGNNCKIRLQEFEFRNGDDIKAYNSRQKVVWFMLQNPGACYRTQTELAKEITKAGAPIKQPAVYKALRELVGVRKRTGKKEFMITWSIIDGYRLTADDEIASEAIAELKRRDCFLRDYVFYENTERPCSFIFWVDPAKAVGKKEQKAICDEYNGQLDGADEGKTKCESLIQERGIETIISTFKGFVGEANYVDVFIYEDKLFVLLKRQATNLIRAQLRGFFGKE